MNVLEVFPPALPLDGAETIAAASDIQLLLFAVGFSIFALGCALFAAVMYARSPLGGDRSGRTTHAVDGEPTSPEVVGSPFPNLLGK